MSRYRSRVTASSAAVSTVSDGRVVLDIADSFGWWCRAARHAVDLLYGAIMKEFSRARS
jgi:hypothetical protein